MHIKIFSFVLCSFATTSLFCSQGSQEITKVSERPTIKGNIDIDGCALSVRFASKRHHENLTKMGIFSCIQSPLIQVRITGKENGNDIDWTENVPQLIKDFECKQYEGQKISLVEVEAKVEMKKLPGHIPAFYFCRANTGTTLSFNIHGYTVQLTCCDSLISTCDDKKWNVGTKSFRAGFTEYMDRCEAGIDIYCLKDHIYDPERPSFVSEEIDSTPELIENGVLKRVEKTANGDLVPLIKKMESLVVILMGKNAEVILLLWPFFSKKI